MVYFVVYCNITAILRIVYKTDSRTKEKDGASRWEFLSVRSRYNWAASPSSVTQPRFALRRDPREPPR